MLSLFLKPILIILGPVMLLWTFYRLLRRANLIRKGKHIYLKNELILSLFVIYITIVLSVTVLPASISGFNNPQTPRLNIVPLINTYKNFIITLSAPDVSLTGYALDNIIGNLVLFIPLGMLLPCISRKFNSIKKIFFICFFFSLSIEGIQFMLIQFGTYRTVDIDDVILNTAGGMLGWLIFSKLINRYLLTDR